MTKDVTAATNPDIPPTHNINHRGAIPEQSPTPSRQPPIEPPTIVSGRSTGSIKSVEGPSRAFTLPSTVSAQQIQRDSFKYGGGRSAGRLSTKP